jgi:4-hydroxy-L-threonine phosphate dehydrogenase PdxA
MQLANFTYTGHTEYFTAKDGAAQSVMFMVSEALKVALVTNHIPVSKVASSIYQRSDH